MRSESLEGGAVFLNASYSHYCEGRYYTSKADQECQPIPPGRRCCQKSFPRRLEVDRFDQQGRGAANEGVDREK